MPKYVIERNISGLGSKTPEEFQNIASKSCSVLNELGPQITWLHSYATSDKMYCVYIAPNAEMIREHARRGGFPADRISEVVTVVDRATAEGGRKAESA